MNRGVYVKPVLLEFALRNFQKKKKIYFMVVVRFIFIVFKKKK